MFGHERRINFVSLGLIVVAKKVSVPRAGEGRGGGVRSEEKLSNLIIIILHFAEEFFAFIFLLQNTVDKLVQRANASLLIGTSSWKEQFIEALTVSAGKVQLCMKHEIDRENTHSILSRQLRV